MSFEDEFNPQQIAGQHRDQYLARMQAQMTPEDAEALADYLGRMAEVAANFIFNERVIKLSEDQPGVPITPPMAHQMMMLFSEGLFFGIMRSHPLDVPDEFRTFMLQNLAGVLFENAKQMAMTTYGQEDTPGVTISDQQQIEMICQTADNALTYYCGEYEKQHGPIALKEPPDPEAAPAASLPVPVEPQAPAETPVPVPPPVQAASPVPSPPVTVPSAQALDYERYAALALFISTLPPSRGRAIIQKLSPEAQRLTAHYSTPEHLEASLDLKRVVRHLGRLKTQFAESQGLNATRKAMLALAGRWQPQALRAIVRHERPAVRAYIDTLLQARAGANASLPPKIEMALYTYLTHQSASP